MHIVGKTDAPQSELRIGHVGLPRRHPDYFPAMMMNAVLGGLFSSRINLNLREAHGYTYGAFSDFEWRRQPGPCVVATALRATSPHAAAREVLKEIDRIRAAPITRRRAVARDELSRRRLPDSLRDDVGDRRGACRLWSSTSCRRTTTTSIASAFAR